MIFILNINYQILADFSLADNAPGPIIGNFYQRLQYIGTTFDYGTMLVVHALKKNWCYRLAQPKIWNCHAVFTKEARTKSKSLNFELKNLRNKFVFAHWYATLFLRQASFREEKIVIKCD